MDRPYFFVADISEPLITLDENTSRHMISVLRLQPGDEVLLTDGKGNRARAAIVSDHRKKATVSILDREVEKEKPRRIRIGISLVKNPSRFEWFLEKATELGVSEIIPLLCERTEKEKFRRDRFEQILVSALLQSQQCRLPLLREPVAFMKLVMEERSGQKFIAHCLDEQKSSLLSSLKKDQTETLILIGPEGDFTPTEIGQALSHNFLAVSLGDTRLRTETAGMVAAVLLCLAD